MTIVHLSHKKISSYLGTVQEIRDISHHALKQFRRAGVLLSTFVQDRKIYFFSVQLGREDEFIRDFGGHIETFLYEHPIEAAWREFTEESLGVFNEYIREEDVLNAPVYFNQDNLYILLNVNLPGALTRWDQEFQKRLTQLPPHAPMCLRETRRIMYIARRTVLAKLNMTHHVKIHSVYVGPSLWKTLRMLAFQL